MNLQICTLSVIKIEIIHEYLSLFICLIRAELH